MSIFLVLSVMTAVAVVGLEIVRVAASGRRLERSLDALRTLGDKIEASFAPLGETIEGSLAQQARSRGLPPLPQDLVGRGAGRDHRKAYITGFVTHYLRN
jgi:hypothetical protein